MGLLAEIQRDAISDATPVSTLLRKCLVLANKLDSNLLEDWVRHELNGYPKDAEVPEYRRIAMHFKASLQNAAYRYTGQPVPQVFVAEATGNKDIATFKCRQAIGTLSEDKIKDAETLVVNFDNYAILLQRAGVFDDSYSVTQFWGEVPTPSVLGIVDAVRNRVLDFALTLSKSYPNAGEVDGISLKEVTVEKTVNQIFNTTINGNAGVISNANNGTVNIAIGRSNFGDLRQQLLQHGVDEDDIKELETAIEGEPQIATDKKFGPKVGQWMGKMVGKAASGAWGVGIQTAGTILEKALLKYYGFE